MTENVINTFRHLPGQEAFQKQIWSDPWAWNCNVQFMLYVCVKHLFKFKYVLAYKFLLFAHSSSLGGFSNKEQISLIILMSFVASTKDLSLENKPNGTGQQQQGPCETAWNELWQWWPVRQRERTVVQLPWRETLPFIVPWIAADVFFLIHPSRLFRLPCILSRINGAGPKWKALQSYTGE